MESILARALEYTLKYWLKSFSRDQFKLQGRKVQLSNLDINGDALHSSMGLPPALHVTTAKVGMLEITLPSVSNVQVEPIVVQIDRLDLVLEEKKDPYSCSTASRSASISSSRGSGYGFADKIADGMTIKVRTVNLLLETRGAGAARDHGGATWTPPMASITIKGLVLYTTNENWQVVNLKEAREFSSKKKFIYLFKKLEWESLSIDLLPHPDMFLDARLSEEGVNKRDDDGAKRVFFGGERLLEGISGQAYITVQRTELNDPLGLEVRLHIGEAVCPALSEPGLRALLRFLTGLYVCLNRGDVDLKSQQRSAKAAGCSLVSILVDHIFFCIKDTDFQIELLVQSLHFSRASVSHGENSRDLTEMAIGGLFVRDTFSNPPCTLIQPSMADVSGNMKPVPDFAKDCCPAIYPLGEQQFQLHNGVPLICIYSLQLKPTPSPPQFASQTAVYCQPLLLYLQEESCFRISSFLADGIVAGSGTVLPDFSVSSLEITLEELDIVVPLTTEKLDHLPSNKDSAFSKSFAGARLHIENIFFSESPSLKMHLLDLEKDPACFCFWEDQPIDASLMKWAGGASFLSLSLETSNGTEGHQNSLGCASGLWRCIELKDACIEVAMATPDGSPLTCAPPAGGVVRVGVACKEYLSNTSVEQLFFVLNLYAYFGNLSEKIVVKRKSTKPSIPRTESWGRELMSKVPSDTAVSLSVSSLQLSFLEDCSIAIQGKPLVQFVGKGFSVKVAHRTLGGAIAISSGIRWEAIEVDCIDADQSLTFDNGAKLTSLSDADPTATCQPQLRAVLWVNNKGTKKSGGNNENGGMTHAVVLPFLDVNMTHVVPFDARDAECHSFSLSACIAGIRLGGGMSYTEGLLHRFGILGPDGGPGEGLSRGLQNISTGPLSKIFKPPPLISEGNTENGAHENGDNIFSHLGQPDDVDVCIDLKDWLFALEGSEDMTDSLFNNHESAIREERCWHTNFRTFRIKAKNNHKGPLNSIVKSRAIHRYPVDLITVGVVDLMALKPQARILDLAGNSVNGLEQKTAETPRGVNFEASMGVSEGDFDFLTGKWELKKLKFSVDKPIEAVITRDEVQHLVTLCKTEVDSMGRIAAGILRILKLEETVGMDALDQLSNLGSGGLDKLFTTEKFLKADVAHHSQLKPETHAIVVSLEEEAKNSQAKCADLIADMATAAGPSVQHLHKIKELESRLEVMQRLLSQLRTHK